MYFFIKNILWDFSWWSQWLRILANAGDPGFSPDLGRFHMPQGGSPWAPWAMTTESALQQEASLEQPAHCQLKVAPTRSWRNLGTATRPSKAKSKHK